MSEAVNVIVALAGAIREHATAVERDSAAVASLDTMVTRVSKTVSQLSNGDFGAYGSTGPGIRIVEDRIYVWDRKRSGGVPLSDLLSHGPDSPETILQMILDAVRLDIAKTVEHATSVESRRDAVRSLADGLASALASLSPPSPK